MTDLLDEARAVLRQHGEDIGRQALREIASLSPADLVRFIQIIRARRKRKIGLQIDSAKLDVSESLEERRRRGEGHQ